MHDSKRPLWVPVAIATAVGIVAVGLLLRARRVDCPPRQDRYDCVVRGAIAANDPQLCWALSPAHDDLCMQEVYEQARDPKVCGQIDKPGVRENCRRYFDSQ